MATNNNNQERDLLELINKNINRNIQRKRESGFTTYVVCGALLFALFWLLDNFSLVLDIPNLLVVTIASNIFIALIILYTSSTIRDFVPRRIKINFDYVPTKTDIYPLIFFLIPYLLLNGFSGFYCNFLWGSIIFWTIFGFLLLNTILPLIKRVRVFLSHPSLFNIDKQRKSISLGANILAMILLVPSTSLVFFTDSEKAIESIKFGVILAGFLSGILALINIRDSKNYLDDLEELEEEIYLRNLSNAEIKQRLEDEGFVGMFLPNWLDRQKIEIQKMWDEFYIELAPFTETLKEIEQIRLQFPDAKDARLDSIISANEDFKEEMEQFYSTLRQQLSEILTWDSITVEDQIIIDDFIKQDQIIIEEAKKKLAAYTLHYNSVVLGITPKQLNSGTS